MNKRLGFGRVMALGLALASMVAVPLSASARDGWGGRGGGYYGGYHGGYHGGYGGYHRGGGHWSGGRWIGGALVAGAVAGVVGSALAPRPVYYDNGPTVVYSQPRTVIYEDAPPVVTRRVVETRTVYDDGYGGTRYIRDDGY